MLTKNELDKMTKKKLLEIAKKHDVKYRTRMAKPKLVSSILELMAQKSEMDQTIPDQIAKYSAQNREDSDEVKQEMEASKYVACDETVTDIQEHTGLTGVPVYEDYHNVPELYNKDEIVLMIIDPTHIHAYWEMTKSKVQQVFSEHNYQGSCEAIVRLYDITDVDFNGSNAWSTQEYSVGYSKGWYFQVEPNRSYCVDLGLKLPDNRFLLTSRSNIVNTPRDTVSEYYDEEWKMIDFDKTEHFYGEMYRLSGGDVGQRSLASSFITNNENENKQEFSNVSPLNLSSEVLSSGSLYYKKGYQKKDFWLWVDTELIVYGQTKADANLTINGKKMQLDKDGRFRIHMALPDGHFPFQVKAVSNCGKMTKQTTPIVDRCVK